jgi:phage/plasmid-associated DNA primase
MKISTNDVYQKFGQPYGYRVVEFETAEQLAEIAKLDWSPAAYGPLTKEDEAWSKNEGKRNFDDFIPDLEKYVGLGYREKKHWVSSEWLLCDIDNVEGEQCSIERFKELFGRYEYFIVTSRNHRKFKKVSKAVALRTGSDIAQPADRYHALFPLGLTVTDRDAMDYAQKTFIESYPFMDDGAKDISRFFFGNKTPIVIHNKGEYISMAVRPVEEKAVKKTAKRPERAFKDKRVSILEKLQTAADGGVFDSYSDWIRLGMALKNDGYTLDDWEMLSHPGQTQTEMQYKWDTFDPTEITGGSLVFFARLADPDFLKRFQFAKKNLEGLTYDEGWKQEDYVDPKIMFKIFLSVYYPNDGYFAHNGMHYTWNGLHWESRMYDGVVEEFYQWAMTGDTTFLTVVENMNILESKDPEFPKYSPQFIFETACKNMKKFRGNRLMTNENPFSMIENVNPYWNFPNGALKIQADGVTWFDRKDNSEQFFMSIFPLNVMGFKYDPTKKDAPLFRATVNRLLPKNHKDDHGLKFILETFAYSLLPEKTVPYYFICYGNEGSGKSSLAEVLKELAGGYFIAKAMKEVFSEFGKSSLVGKLIVYDDDISDDYVLPTEIKKLSGDTVLTINEKQKPHYQARLNLAPWMIGNKPPKTTGSAGHSRRAIVMHFSSDERRDPFHMKKMFGKIIGHADERPAILNMVLEVLPEFVKRGLAFDAPPWAVDDHDEWIGTSNSIGAYFKEMNSSGDGEPRYYNRVFVYNHYSKWSELNGYKPLSSENFYRGLDGEKIKTKRTANCRTICCYFDLPKIASEDRHILKGNENVGFEQQVTVGLFDEQEDTPF